MDIMRDYILWAKATYIETIRRLRSELRFLPDGKLIMKQSEKRRYFYVSHDGKQSLIKKGDKALLFKYARKFFVQSCIKTYEKDLMAIEIAESYFEGFSIENFLDTLPTKYKYIPKEAFLKSSIETKKSENPYKREFLLHTTNCGIHVRSKSEVIIANTLNAMGVEFYYEKKLMIEGNAKYPDFTIVHPVTKENIYWEHFGMLENSDYEREMNEKLELYRKNGITQWNNLIITYDDPGGTIDSTKIRNIIRMFLGMEV